MSVHPVSGTLFPGYGGAEQERQRRSRRRDDWLIHRLEVIDECARLNRRLTYCQQHGLGFEAASLLRQIDAKLEAVRA